MRPSLFSGGSNNCTCWRISLFFIYILYISQVWILSFRFPLLFYCTFETRGIFFSILLHFLSNPQRHINMKKCMPIVTFSLSPLYTYIIFVAITLRSEFTENLSVSIPVGNSHQFTKPQFRAVCRSMKFSPTISNFCRTPNGRDSCTDR